MFIFHFTSNKFATQWMKQVESIWKKGKKRKAVEKSTHLTCRVLHTWRLHMLKVNKRVCYAFPAENILLLDFLLSHSLKFFGKFLQSSCVSKRLNHKCKFDKPTHVYLYVYKCKCVREYSNEQNRFKMNRKFYFKMENNPEKCKTEGKEVAGSK